MGVSSDIGSGMSEVRTVAYRFFVIGDRDASATGLPQSAEVVGGHGGIGVEGGKCCQSGVAVG
jgi:hypothetical protein